MSALTGTWRLVRLALRRDRIKLPAWVVSVSALTVLSVPAIEETVGATAEDRLMYAGTVANSVVSRLFEGAIDGPSIGSIIATELFVFVAVLFAFMCTLTVVRHTRQNEETGSAELISSTVVGRYASLTAALSVAFGASLLTGLLVFAGLAQFEALSLVGSFGMSMAFVVVGCAFAVVAAVTAQVAETTRGANSLAGTSIAVAYALRAIGDGFGEADMARLSVDSMWVSWLSPIGWGQQIFPYTQGNWWIFSLFIIFFFVVGGLAYFILRHRDVGLGLISARIGPAEASSRLRGVIGLAWRLQRGVIYGWAVGLAFYGAIVGGVAQEFEELILNSEVMQELFGGTNGGADFADILFGAMFIYIGAIAAAYCVQTLLKLRSEEVKGHLEALLGTATGRMRWMLSHIVWMVIGLTFVMFVAGLATGTVHALISNGSWSEPLRIGGIALAQLPAILALAGTIVMVYGLRSNWSTVYAWVSFIVVLLITQLGDLLGFPQLVMNISPFGHLSNYPTEPLAQTAIAVLLGVAFTTTVIGLLAFRRRDIATS